MIKRCYLILKIIYNACITIYRYLNQYKLNNIKSYFNITLYIPNILTKYIYKDCIINMNNMRSKFNDKMQTK